DLSRTSCAPRIHRRVGDAAHICRQTRPIFRRMEADHWSAGGACPYWLRPSAVHHAATGFSMFLERDPFLNELQAARARAAAGQGCIVLVSGEAGIGKTTLVEQDRKSTRLNSSHVK